MQKYTDFQTYITDQTKLTKAGLTVDAQNIVLAYDQAWSEDFDNTTETGIRPYRLYYRVILTLQSATGSIEYLIALVRNHLYQDEDRNLLEDPHITFSETDNGDSTKDMILTFWMSEVPHFAVTTDTQLDRVAFGASDYTLAAETVTEADTLQGVEATVL